MVPEINGLQNDLLTWYEKRRRPLPWRETRDPYAILVAEFMLQQTQVERVLPKYAEFLARFPTLQALALASTADIIRTWRGLGYNRRAVHLQAIARQVMDEFRGRLPDDIESLRRLRGIGQYTAGAIACFAFARQVAFMDTNIRRVLRRLFLGEEQPSQRYLMEIATAALPDGRSYDWHQALMDLGAKICTARAPACRDCPIRKYCRWYQESRPTPLTKEWPTSRVAETSAPYAGEARPALVLEHPPSRPQRRKATRRERPFVGSSRYYRGRIVATLCEAYPKGMPLPALAAHLGFALTDDGLGKVQALIGALAADGLVELIETSDGTLVKLPE